MKTIQIVPFCASAMACLTAAAQTLTWVGGAEGNYSAADAWQTSGGASAVPQSGDALVIPAECRVNVNAAQDSTFPKIAGVDIATNATLNLSNFSGTYSFTPVLSGEGTLSVTDSATTWVRFKADNSGFNGRFSFVGSTVCIDHKKALGIACPVTATGPTSGQSWFYFNGVDGAVFQNPMTITSRNNFTFASYGCKVEFAGEMKLNGYTRFQAGNDATGSRYVFSGPVTLPSTFDSYMGVQNTYIEFASAGVRDMGGATLSVTTTRGNAQDIRFSSPLQNCKLQLNNANVRYRILADTTFSTSASVYLLMYNGLLDVSGHALTIGRTWQGDAAYKFVWTAGGNKVITASEAPGRFVVSGMVNGPNDSTFDGRLCGHVTVDYNSSFDGAEEGKNGGCWYFKLSNVAGEVSDTDGDIVATKGWLELKSGLNAPNIGHLVAKNAGRITVNTGVTTNPDAIAQVYGKGSLSLKEGVNLTVDRLWIYDSDASETYKEVVAGQYSSVADPSKGIKALSCLVGPGVLTVKSPLKPFTLFVK